mgnify:FL=1
MTAKVHIVQNTQNLAQNNGSPLKSGTVVNGRVLTANGGSSYTVSLAGQKIDVQSSLPLKAGQVFTAKIEVFSNTVSLKLIHSNSSQNLSNADSSKNLLQSMNLPAVKEALNLVIFALESGIKPESEKFLRSLARGKSKQNSTVDEEKAQTALLLEEKGIRADSNSIEKIAGYLGERGGKGQQKNHNQQNDKQKFLQKTNDEKKDYQIDSSDIKEYFSELDYYGSKNHCGVLTLFNSLKNSQNSDMHWAVFPFEWSFKDFNGVIRVLFSPSEKKLKKMIIDLANSTTFYKFVIYLKNGKVDSLKMGVGKGGGAEASLELKAQLKDFFKVRAGLPADRVDSVNFDELSGYGAENDFIPVFEGEA